MDQKFLDVLNRANPRIAKNPGINLVVCGIVDSLDIVNIVAMCEKEFNIDFDPGDVNSDNFASAEAMWACFSKYLK